MGKAPSTSATRLLREKGVAYTEHLYRYEEKGGTRVSSRELGVDEHAVVKTLVMEDDRGAPVVANRHSGYQVGGTSPLGTRKIMPVCIERSILELPRIYVNGGSRGFLVGVAPRDLVPLLAPTLVDVALAE